MRILARKNGIGRSEHQMKSETQIKKEILDGIKREFPEICIFRVWCGQTFAKKGGLIIGATPGTPDLCGYLPDGRFLGIEVKKPKGRTEPSRAKKQEEFRERARNAGCVCFQTTSWAECRQKLNEALNPLPFSDLLPEAPNS